MTFTISSGGSSYTLPLDPQDWQYNPKPRLSTQKTLGGQVVQLLGYSVEGSFGGLLHGGMVGKEQAWNDMSLFLTFMSKVMLNQKNGVQTTISWAEEGVSFECALGDVSYSENLETVGYTYSVPFLRLSRSTALRDAAARSSVLDLMLTQVGFTAGEAGFHGGTMGTAMQWTYDENGSVTGGVFDASAISPDAITPITGFSTYGPSVSQSSDNTVDAQLSQDSSTAEIQQYAHDKVIAMGWTEADFTALVQLWNRESRWNPNAENPSSGAYGIPQANPSGGHPIANDPNYRNNWKVQVDWGLDYIRKRYGSPSAAWSHSQATGWY